MKSFKGSHSLTTFAATGAALLMVTVTSGCAGVLVGSAATSAVVANDERTTGTFIEDQTIELKALDAIRSREHLKSQTPGADGRTAQRSDFTGFPDREGQSGIR